MNDRKKVKILGKFYKTGEFAKMANLSIRTIRYYDNIGLLKPSRIANNGYRLYDDHDFMKLQKILSLKYLGFSLEDIFSMTATDSYISLKESLKLQTKMIDQKIQQFNHMKSSLEETICLLDQNKDVSWVDIMKNIHMSTMERDLIEQYKNATNVDIRIRLHDQYSKNPISWFCWLYQHYHLTKQSQILELGCGNGKLWKDNQTLIQGHIVLSDISQGMIDDAKENLKLIDNIDYACFDCHCIPYEDESFDIIIANHLMFYLKDIDTVLKELKRVLKPGGYFYCSTYGQNHMKEITDLVKEYDPQITLSEILLYDVFGLENGYQILEPYFKNIEIDKYADALEVTNMDDIANYILSCHGNQSEYISKDYLSFKKFLDKKSKKNHVFHITKDAGLFICQKEY